MATEFIPALRFAALTPWYDRTIAWSTRAHAAGTLATYLLDGGFSDVQSLAPLPVPLGSIDFLMATRPPRA
jgi:hypothetical protein